MKLNYKDAYKLFCDIFNRGTQWEIAEVENDHRELSDIDTYDDWMSYGNNQDKSATIFNKKKTGWRIVRIFDDLDSDDYDEITVDYFDESHDYDEFSISIRKV